MKRKPLIVLLVLLLVGILAFTVFACNNNQNGGQNNNNNNNNNDDDDDDNNGNEDEEEITYEIAEALPKLVTGIDKVAAKVADVNEGKAAYLGADINLVLGVTAEEVKAIDLNLGLSLKVSVDQDDSANSWALIGLTSGGDEIAQIYLAVEGGKEHIYVKEALTGASNWKLISVLDTAEKTGLEGLFTGEKNGLINKLFGFISSFVGAEEPLINFDSATPISSIELMKGLSLNTILGLVDTLDLGKTLDGVLHAEAYDDGSGYTAELNRAGIGDLLTKLGPTIKTFAPDLDLYGTLRGLNPILSMVLGMSVNENEDTFDIDDKANPKLTIDFSLNDDAALENLSINFNNPDIEGLGIELKFAINNIELGGESKKSDVNVSGYENLGLNLAVEAQLPAWGVQDGIGPATVAVSVNPNAVIGWDANGKIKFDLSGIEGHATFNGATIAQYTEYNGAVAEFEGKKGFAITLKPVYDFIAKGQTGDQRDNVYFIKCDLEKIMNPSTASAASELSNAAYADEDEPTLYKLITAIKAGVSLGNIGDVIGPILTDDNNLVGMLLDLLGTNGAIGLVPALGNKPNGDISVTVNADKLVKFAMGENLLGGIESMIKIELYDASNPASGIQPPKTLSDIFEGDLVDVLIDLVYTAMYEGAQNDKTNPYTGTFAQYMEGKITPTEIVDGIIKTVAEKWNITALKDGALKVSEIGDIVATITYGDSLSAKLDLLGAYIQIGANLDTYKAPNATASIDTKDAEPMGKYIDGKLVVAFNDSNLEKALLELAEYALGIEIAA